MAQPSIAHYYNSRKRKALEDFKIDSAPKNLKLQLDASNKTVNVIKKETSAPKNLKLLVDESNKAVENVMKKKEKSAPKNVKLDESIKAAENTTKKEKSNGGSSQNIQTFLNNMKKDVKNVPQPKPTEEKGTKDLNEIRKKLIKSDKLAELKASLARFKKSEEQLKAAEKKTEELLQSPKLKTFKSINFEVQVSPSKTFSPEKLYLSPKKDSTVRRNLFDVSSPTKSDTTARDVADSTQPSLQLPFKYRTLSEIFRAMDTVTQILYNRKELITYNKLKPAVEKMIKRNFVQKHLAQIKSVYSDAYKYTVEKLKAFGLQQFQWDLVISPEISSETMTTQLLLDRRRKLYQMLIDKIKDYHNEFLMSLTPPMVIPKDKIKHWHPEFDIERVPDIELAELPQLPSNEKCATGKEILENARKLFNCNTRMNKALLNLKEMNEKASGTEEQTEVQTPSIIKGIPQALLEKVRQRQAAKALLSMTRTVDQEKELQMYTRLPEIARLIRNLFVTEKKGVLELDTIVEKLGNSYRSFINKKEIEDHLKIISEKVPGWLVFHKLRNSMFIKLDKNADLSLVLNKLEKLAKEKSES